VTEPSTVVVFGASPEQVEGFDLVAGPCVAVGAGKRPLVSPLLQDNGENPAQSAALFTVLTGAPSDSALHLVAEDAPSRLFVCDVAFRDAMADKISTMIDMELDAFAEERERLSRTWMSQVPWPPHYVSLVNRLERMGRARAARSKSLPLFHWFGAPVPMVAVTSGSGPYPRRT
jgi:hypothetical protein